MPIASVHSFTYRPPLSQIPHNISTVPFTPLLEVVYIIARSLHHLFSRRINFSLKKKQSKWQPVCHNAVVPHPHVIAEYPYHGIEYHYPYFRRNSRFRRYQSGKIPVNVLRRHTARVSRICTTTIVSIPFPLSFSIDVLNDIRHQTNYYSSRRPLPPT